MESEYQTLIYEFQVKDVNGQLLNLCLQSREIYNLALGYLDSSEDKSEFHLNTFFKNHDLIKGFIKVQAARQSLAMAAQSYRSYLKLVEIYYKDPKRLNGKPEKPSLSDRCQTVSFPNQSCQIKNNYIILSKQIKIRIPQKFDNHFQQVRINHCHGNIFKVGIIYRKEIVQSDIDYKNLLSIDLGSVNLASCVDSKMNATIVSNSNIRSIIGKYLHQTKRKKNKIKIARKRNRRIKDRLHKLSRKIVNNCVENRIGTIIIGNNKDWKRQSKLSKRVNRYFVGTAHQKLIDMITYKAKMIGIRVHINEESYTSKCDALALEKICKHENYLGERKTRGLFESSAKILINADINGALNIMRKYLNNVVGNDLKEFTSIQRRLLSQPDIHDIESFISS